MGNRGTRIMDIEKKISMLEETLDLEAGDLKPEMVLADIEEYNSMAKLALIVLMSDEFDKKLTSDQIKTFVTVQDILDFMG